jgi:hypothetical protein
LYFCWETQLQFQHLDLADWDRVGCLKFFLFEDICLNLVFEKKKLIFKENLIKLIFCIASCNTTLFMKALQWNFTFLSKMSKHKKPLTQHFFPYVLSLSRITN